MRLTITCYEDMLWCYVMWICEEDKMLREDVKIRCWDEMLR